MDKKIEYQWIKGDLFGKIVLVDREDDEFTYFTNGSKIYNNVKDEFLMLVDEENPKLLFNDREEVDNSVREEVDKSVREEVDKSVREEVEVLHKGNNISPIMDLLMKLKPKQTKINIEIDISIPPTNLYNIMKEAYGNEVDACIESYAMDSINKDTIFSKIEQAIFERVQNFINKEMVNE